MDPDFYDEFGNYIGPELESDEDDDDESEEDANEHQHDQDMDEQKVRENRDDLCKGILF